MEYDGFVGQRANTDNVTVDYKGTVVDDGHGHLPSTYHRVIRFDSVGVMVDVYDGGKITTKGDGTQVPHFNLARGDCRPNTEGTQKILGFDTFHIKYPAKQFDDEQELWLAPDLDCQSLRTITTFKKDGMDSGTKRGDYDGYTEITVTKAVVEEPDPSFFKLPDNPIEMSPSMYFGSIARRSTRQHDLDSLVKEDQVYFSQQKQRAEKGVTVPQ